MEFLRPRAADGIMKSDEIPKHEIVIAGISGRFPESDSMLEFQENLLNGVDMVTDKPGRWPSGLYSLPSRMGQLKTLDKFDSEIFGIHAKQAQLMDPQLRMLHEVTFEAILDAGVNPTSIRGSKTGVFVGNLTAETFDRWSAKAEDCKSHLVTGGLRAMFANRISYSFDLTGPSCTIDSGCSSTFTALEQAVLSIRIGLCDAAIVAGVNLCLKPTTSLLFKMMGAMGPEGKCKSFDKSADGYVRSEAVVAIYITRAEICYRNYATILHVKTNADGYKEEGITCPSRKFQSQLMEEMYAEAGVDPNDVSYVETHGTGTNVGDPIEANAIADVFCKQRSSKNPLLIGSVKSNMGHSEPAAGLCGLAKLIIAINSGVIPGNLHFSIPNPNIPAFAKGTLKVVDKNTPWTGGIVGLNSFGFGGTNAHLILRTNPKKIPERFTSLHPLLLPMSSRTIEGLEHTFRTIQSKLIDHEQVSLLQNIAMQDIPGHKYRGFLLCTKDGIIAEEKQLQPATTTSSPEIWFVFSGMGSQWAGMGRDLLNLKSFYDSISQLGEILKPFGIDLIRVLLEDPGEGPQSVLNSFLAITATQIALVDLMSLIGITPERVVGHSIGELACAYADGCLTAEQTILAAHSRGIALVNSKSPPGSMAAIGLPVMDVIKQCPDDIFPACFNSLDNTTVAGPPDSISAFVEVLKSKGDFAKEVSSAGYAFHSKYIKKAVPELKEFLHKIIPEPKPRSQNWISSSLLETQWNTPLGRLCSPEYLANNLLSPVYFHQALAQIPPTALIVEIGPHSLLQSILKRSTPSTCVNIGLTHRNSSNNLNYLLKAIGKLYNHGLQPKLSNLYDKINYPVSTKASFISSLVQWDHAKSWDVAFYEKLSSIPDDSVHEISLSNEDDRFYAGHCIDDKILFPASGYLCLVWKVFANRLQTLPELLPVVFENVQLHRACILQDDSTLGFRVIIFETSGEFQVQEGSSVVVSGIVRRNQDESLSVPTSELPANSSYLPLSQKEVYKELRLRGYDHKDGLFKQIQEMDNDGNWCNIAWKDNWVTFLDTLLQFAILGTETREFRIFTQLERLAIDPKMFLLGIPNTGIFNVAVLNDKLLDTIRCSGIEIRGVHLESLPKKAIQATPTLEEYRFMPYFDKVEDLGNAGTVYSAIYFMSHIVMENVPCFKLVVSEIVGEGEHSLARLINDIINKDPLYSAVATVYARSRPALEEIIEKSELSSSPVEAKTFSENFDAGTTHLLIMQDDASLVQLTATMKVGSFLLLASRNPLNELPEGLILVSSKTLDGASFFLYRKILLNSETILPHIIHVHHNNFDWINELKSKMADEQSTSSIVLVGNRGSGILGLVNSLKGEPGGDKIRCYFLNDKKTKVDLNFTTPSSYLLEIIHRDLLMNVFENDEWGCYRHFPLDLAQAPDTTIHNMHLDVSSTGDLSSLAWFQAPLNHPVQEVKSTLCQVFYASLNTRDLMLALGKLSVDSLPGEIQSQTGKLGTEFSGKDTAGKRIMGCVPTGALSSYVTLDSQLVWPVPDKWTLAEAASIPIAYTTAYYALIIRASLKSGETILIHNGSEGVAQAAISIALHMNCNVHTTVGSSLEKDFLLSKHPDLKTCYIYNSTDSSFEKYLLTNTNGQGADVVMIFLSGEQGQASIRCLKKRGRFLGIGNAHADSASNFSLRSSALRKSISFHRILLDSFFDSSSQEKITLVQLLAQGIQSNCVQPLSSHIFPSAHADDAFRFLAGGKHTGKVLLQIRDEYSTGLDQRLPVKVVPRTYFDAYKSYIVIGGLGGFGLELCNWLVERGARKLILVSRSGVTSGYQDMCLRRWSSRSVDVAVSYADVTTLKGTRELLLNIQRYSQIGGIFNLAMVLRDAFLQNLTPSDFLAVAQPKIHATAFLDEVSRECGPGLDYFVAFSSMSSGRGKEGQSNYAYANSAVERICEKRREDGFHALAIQWSQIGDVGFVEEHMDGDKDVIRGIKKQGIASCLATLDVFLQQPKSTVASMVLADKSLETKLKQSGGNKFCLVERILNILGIQEASSVDLDASLVDLGLDSFMGVEVKQLLQQEKDLIFSMAEIRRLNIRSLHNIMERDNVVNA